MAEHCFSHGNRKACKAFSELYWADVKELNLNLGNYIGETTTLYIHIPILVIKLTYKFLNSNPV